MQGREKGIRQLMAINMLKRLESSVNSFRLTIQRIQELIQNTISRIENFAQGRYEYTSLETEDYYPSMVAEEEEFYGSSFIGGKKTKIDLADMDYASWRQYLIQDKETLNFLLTMLQKPLSLRESLSILYDIFRKY